MQKCLEFSQVINELQEELSSLRSSLSKVYWPELEAQVQRLSIERDETIISWGQVLLGLCSSGAQLKLHTHENEVFNIFGSANLNHHIDLKAKAANGNSAESSLYNERSFNHHVPTLNGRVLGQALQDDSYHFHTSSAFHERYDREQGEIESIDEDLGEADAPKVDLAQFFLEELREQMF